MENCVSNQIPHIETYPIYRTVDSPGTLTLKNPNKILVKILPDGSVEGDVKDFSEAGKLFCMSIEEYINSLLEAQKIKLKEEFKRLLDSM